MLEKINGRGAIIGSLFIALILAIIPLPPLADLLRPDWVLVCVFYWTIALPHRSNVGVAFAVGLILDILLGSTLGVRALALSIVSYIAASNFTRLRNFSVWQQALVVGALTGLAKVVVFWAEYLVQDIQLPAGYFYPLVTTTLTWPWIFLLLRKLRRQWKIS
ncbi:rod shape-determining protein MreD [Agarivorans gilvus]|jgi:rod shape-determining protein MreD|uniref:Rod shape-determining protein MreD n=1 Tax=Agarivorans gilvus TaxID=680279 RepID=A0ABQ1HZ38_9ALTE|nr:rod shape-determining protein MreD [Agarivorans gilvus]GGA96193.1 rod shape-determining protein MreD [Agarivorans gilvus]